MAAWWHVRALSEGITLLHSEPAGTVLVSAYSREYFWKRTNDYGFRYSDGRLHTDSRTERMLV